MYIIVKPIAMKSVIGITVETSILASSPAVSVASLLKVFCWRVHEKLVNHKKTKSKEKTRRIT